ncbi:MAG: hypothetical protein NTW19_12050 [Planctomycetota bacterium]|nr:hypothetical protein [Planctomycetota bacterium]
MRSAPSRWAGVKSVRPVRALSSVGASIASWSPVLSAGLAVPAFTSSRSSRSPAAGAVTPGAAAPPLPAGAAAPPASASGAPGSVLPVVTGVAICSSIDSMLSSNFADICPRSSWSSGSASSSWGVPSRRRSGAAAMVCVWASLSAARPCMAEFV